MSKLSRIRVRAIVDVTALLAVILVCSFLVHPVLGEVFHILGIDVDGSNVSVRFESSTNNYYILRCMDLASNVVVAADMGLGTIDLDAVKVEEVSV